MTYAFAKLTVTNPASLAAYREKAAEALTKHNGSVVQASKDVAILDGTPDIPDMAVLLSFPSRDAAFAWINDPELAHIHDLRRNAGGSDILVFE